jgi:hypothetical protein
MSKPTSRRVPTFAALTGLGALIAGTAVALTGGQPAMAANIGTMNGPVHANGPKQTAPACSTSAAGAHSTRNVAHLTLGITRVDLRLHVHQSLLLEIPPVEGSTRTVPHIASMHSHHMLCVLSQTRQADGTFVERLLPLRRGEVKLMNGPTTLGVENFLSTLNITIGSKHSPRRSAQHR